MNKEELEEKNRIFNLEYSIRSDSRKTVSIQDLKQMLFYSKIPTRVRKNIDNLNDFFFNLGIEIGLGFQIDTCYRGKWPDVTRYFATGKTQVEKTYYYFIDGGENLTEFVVHLADCNIDVRSHAHSSIEGAMTEAMELWQRKTK